MRDWLKQKRAEKGLTMAEMATQLDLTESYYSRIENGDRQKKMDIALLCKLSDVLGMATDEIILLERTEAGQ